MNTSKTNTIIDFPAIDRLDPIGTIVSAAEAKAAAPADQLTHALIGAYAVLQPALRGEAQAQLRQAGLTDLADVLERKFPSSLEGLCAQLYRDAKELDPTLTGSWIYTDQLKHPGAIAGFWLARDGEKWPGQAKGNPHG